MILDGRPLRGKELDQLKDFLGSREVEYDPEAEYTVCLLNDSYEIEAAGSQFTDTRYLFRHIPMYKNIQHIIFVF